MKTAVQQVFSDLEKLQPHLFNMHSVEGREFVNHFHKYLDVEKQQIINAYETSHISMMTAKQYYNETFKSEI